MRIDIACSETPKRRAIVAEARDAGLEVMHLDTGPKQREAQRHYWRLGLQAMEPYYDLDQKMRE